MRGLFGGTEDDSGLFGSGVPAPESSAAPGPQGAIWDMKQLPFASPHPFFACPTDATGIIVHGTPAAPSQSAPLSPSAADLFGGAGSDDPFSHVLAPDQPAADCFGCGGAQPASDLFAGGAAQPDSDLFGGDAQPATDLFGCGDSTEVAATAGMAPMADENPWVMDYTPEGYQVTRPLLASLYVTRACRLLWP